MKNLFFTCEFVPMAQISQIDGKVGYFYDSDKYKEISGIWFEDRIN